MATVRSEPDAPSRKLSARPTTARSRSVVCAVAALLSSKAQWAAYLARSGETERALATYRELVGNVDGKPAAALSRLLVPFFDLLTSDGDGGAEAAADMAEAYSKFRGVRKRGA